MRRSRKLFVNLAVRDLERARGFFGKLGFEFDPKLTDERAACMIVSSEACVMLSSVPFFATFTRRELCDTTRAIEGMFAVSCDSRAEVDALLRTALAEGGRRAMDPIDHGFMYATSFYDLDGHHWELVWMDPGVGGAC